MGERISEIDWTAANCFRLATVVLQTVLVLQFAMMLSHYYWRIIPLRKQHSVLAPPIRWTFAYHLIVAVYLATTAISNFQRVAFDRSTHVTLSTWLSPLISLALIVVIGRFVKYYSEELTAAEDRSHHFRS